MIFDDEYFMQQAYREALKAAEEDEIPVGAVIVCQNKIIARAHNMTERLNDVTAHAEMQAFTAAADYLGGKYLEECTLYVTIEPCIMCAGATFWTQIDRIVYGASDPKRGYTLLSSEASAERRVQILHHRTSVTSGIMENECSKLLSDYFKRKRSL